VATQTPSDRGVRPGELVQFRLLFGDVFQDAENDALTLTITKGDGTALPSWLSASRDAQTGEIVFTANPPAGMADTDLVVKLAAHETANPTNVASTTFTVKVRHNNAPTVLAGAQTTLKATVGQSMVHLLSPAQFFSDIDVNETLALSLVGGGLPAWVTATVSNGTIRLEGTPPSVQSATFTVRVTDSRGAFAERTLTLSATMNLPPVVVATPAAQDASIGQAFTWSMPLSQVFSDPNGDPLQVTVSGLPGWLSYQYVENQGAPLLRITGQVPTSETNGQTYNVVLTAREPSGATVSTTLQVLVTTNLAPVIPTFTVPAAKQNVAYSTTLPMFGDYNGDTLTVSVSNLPPGMSFNPATRVLSGTPPTAGSWTVSYQAYDGRATTVTTFTLSVQANTAPNSFPVTDKTVGVGANVALVLPQFTDPDGDTLSYSISNLPPGLSFNAATRTITGTPSTTGAWTVTYSAADGRGGTVSTTFVCTISAQPVNQPPQVISPLSDRQAEGNVLFSYPIPTGAFVDPEGAALTYTYSILSSDTPTGWLTFNPTSKTFSGTPHAAADGTIVVRVTVTDNQGATAYDDFVIQVYPYQGGGEEQPLGIGGETESASYAFDMGMEIDPYSGGGETGPVYGEIHSTGSTPVVVPPQEQWFTYDAENRLKISGGILSGVAGGAGTQVVLTMSTKFDSHELNYDAMGRVLMVARKRANQYGQDTVMVNRTVYDERGQRLYEFHAQTIGTPENGIAARYVYDQAGQLTETRRYFSNGTTLATGVNIEGEPQRRDVSGWLSHVEQMRYDADGRMMWQVTLERGDTVPYVADWNTANPNYGQDISKLDFVGRVDYNHDDATPANHDDNPSGYDAAGRLVKYRYTSRSPSNVWYTNTYDISYVGWESWQQVQNRGWSTDDQNYRTTTTWQTYDAYGRLIQQQEHTNNVDGLKDRIRTFAYNADGAVLSRREGKLDNGFVQDTQAGSNNPQNYRFVHAAGQQMAELQAGGAVRAATPNHGPAGGGGIDSGHNQVAAKAGSSSSGSSYTGPFGSMSNVAGGGLYSVAGGSVVVQQGETLRSLAQRVYGTDTLWYVLADANGMSDANAALTAGVLLKAPATTVVTNDASTFKPYNPSDAIGSLAPNLPYVPKPQCDAITIVMIAIIVIAVSVATWGALTGPAIAAGTATATTFIVAGAAAGAAGALAGGVVSSVMGAGSFSWRNVAAGAIAGAITGGLGYWAQAAAQTAQMAATTAATVTNYVAQAVRILGNATAGYIGNKIAGVPNTHFSWKSVAASVIAQGLSSAAGYAISASVDNPQVASFLSGLAGGVISAGIRKGMGVDKEFDWMSVAQGALQGAIHGSMLGGSNKKESVNTSKDLSKSNAAYDVALDDVIGPHSFGDDMAEGWGNGQGMLRSHGQPRTGDISDAWRPGVGESYGQVMDARRARIAQERDLLADYEVTVNGRPMSAEQALIEMRKNNLSLDLLEKARSSFLRGAEMDRMDRMNAILDDNNRPLIRDGASIPAAKSSAISGEKMPIARVPLAPADLIEAAPPVLAANGAENGFDAGVLAIGEKMAEIRKQSLDNITNASSAPEAAIASTVYAINSVTNSVVGGLVGLARIATSSKVRQETAEGLWSLVTTRPDITAQNAWNAWSAMPRDDKLASIGGALANPSSVAKSIATAGKVAKAGAVAASAPFIWRNLPDSVPRPKQGLIDIGGPSRPIFNGPVPPANPMPVDGWRYQVGPVRALDGGGAAGSTGSAGAPSGRGEVVGSEKLRLSPQARARFREGKYREAMDAHYEDLVRRRTGGSSKVIDGREIDSVTDGALIEAKRSYAAIDNPDSFKKSHQKQIKAIIASARELNKPAEFWFKFGVHPKMRAYIEERGGVVKTGLGD